MHSGVCHTESYEAKDQDVDQIRMPSPPVKQVRFAESVLKAEDLEGRGSLGGGAEVMDELEGLEEQILTSLKNIEEDIDREDATGQTSHDRSHDQTDGHDMARTSVDGSCDKSHDMMEGSHDHTRSDISISDRDRRRPKQSPEIVISSPPDTLPLLATPVCPDPGHNKPARPVPDARKLVQPVSEVHKPPQPLSDALSEDLKRKE